MGQPQPLQILAAERTAAGQGLGRYQHCQRLTRQRPQGIEGLAVAPAQPKIFNTSPTNWASARARVVSGSLVHQEVRRQGFHP